MLRVAVKLDSSENRNVPLQFVSVRTIWVTSQIASLLLLSFAANATSLDEALYARNRFQSMAEAGRNGGLPHSLVFEFLKLVAMNKRSEVDPELSSQVGFDRTELRTGYFGAVGVREEAFRALGFLATEEARRFLDERTQAELRTDEVDQLWPVIRIAFYQSQLMPFITEGEKFRFLESVMKAEHDNRALPGVLWWAANRLCDAGALDFLPAASRVFSRLYPASHEAHVQFCQQRMWVIASNPDKMSALTSVLTIENVQAHPNMVHWAIEQLQQMRSQVSNDVVEKFLGSLEAIPADTTLGVEVRETVLRRYRLHIMPPPPPR